MPCGKRAGQSRHFEKIEKQILSGFVSVSGYFSFFGQKMFSVSFRHAALSTGLIVALHTPTTKRSHGFRSPAFSAFITTSKRLWTARPQTDGEVYLLYLSQESYRHPKDSPAPWDLGKAGIKNIPAEFRRTRNCARKNSVFLNKCRFRNSETHIWFTFVRAKFGASALIFFLLEPTM